MFCAQNQAKIRQNQQRLRFVLHGLILLSALSVVVELAIYPETVGPSLGLWDNYSWRWTFLALVSIFVVVGFWLWIYPELAAKKKGTFFLIEVLLPGIRSYRQHLKTYSQSLAAPVRSVERRIPSVRAYENSHQRQLKKVFDVTDICYEVSHAIELEINQSATVSHVKLVPNLLWPVALQLGYCFPGVHDIELVDFHPGATGIVSFSLPGSKRTHSDNFPVTTDYVKTDYIHDENHKVKTKKAIVLDFGEKSNSVWDDLVGDGQIVIGPDSLAMKYLITDATHIHQIDDRESFGDINMPSLAMQISPLLEHLKKQAHAGHQELIVFATAPATLMVAIGRALALLHDDFFFETYDS